jgi:hypothetical protein
MEGAADDGFARRPGTFGLAAHPMSKPYRAGAMSKHQVKVRPTAEGDLVAGARRGDETAVRAIVRQNNRRLFRVARAIVRDDSEASRKAMSVPSRALMHVAATRA